MDTFSLTNKNHVWAIHIIGWILCGVILFLSGLGHQSILSSIIRNGVFVIIGFALSLGLRISYNFLWKKYHSIFLNGLAACGLSYLCGIISGFILNPISFIGFRGGLGDEPLSVMFAGVLNFGFVFMIWSVAYYGFKYYQSSLTTDIDSPTYLDKISVDTGKQIFLVKIKDISHIKAEGDYIRIVCMDRSYLVRKSLSSIQQELDPMIFKKIHRSTIVNMDCVTSLKPHTNGEYFVILEDNTELKLSRNHRHVLKHYT